MKKTEEIDILKGRIGFLEAENQILRDSRAMWIKTADESDKRIQALQDAANTTYKSREEWEKAFHEVCAQRDTMKRERDAAIRIRNNRANRIRQVAYQIADQLEGDSRAFWNAKIIMAAAPAADEAESNESVPKLVADVALYRRDAEQNFTEFWTMKQLRDKAVDKLRYIKQLLADVS